MTRDEILAQIASLGEVQKTYRQTMANIQKVFEHDPMEVARMINATERAMKRVTKKQNDLSKSLGRLDRAQLASEGGQYVYHDTDGDFRHNMH